MPGAFDFYVDESLLRKLLSDEPVPEAKPVAEQPPAPAAALNGHGHACSNHRNGHHAEPVHSEPAVERHTAAGPSVEELFQAGAFGDALARYEELLTANPDEEPELRYNIGLCQQNLGDREKALAEFQRAFDAKPDSEVFALALGSELVAQGRPAEAASMFQSLLERNPDAGSPEVWRGWMAAEASAGNPQKTLPICDRLLETCPGDLQVLECRLAAADAAGDRREVTLSARHLLALQPDHAGALRVLLAQAFEDTDSAAIGELAGPVLEMAKARRGEDHSELLLRLAAYFLSREDWAQAAEAARVALRPADNAQPDSETESHFDANVLLGEALFRSNQIHEACLAFEAADAIRPDDPVVLWNLALLYERLEDLPKAADLLRRSAANEPDWAPEALLRLATIEIRDRQFENAAATLGACLEAQPDLAEAHFQLGVALYGQGDRDHAQEAMLKAIRLAPSSIEWIQELERIAVEHGDALLALDCHEKLIEASKVTPEMDYNLAVVMQAENELELAVRFYLRALEQKPDFEQALLNLGHALSGLGRESEAKVCWSKAIRLDPTLAAGYFE